jgi:hypothetical protein
VEEDERAEAGRVAGWDGVARLRAVRVPVVRAEWCPSGTVCQPDVQLAVLAPGAAGEARAGSGVTPDFTALFAFCDLHASRGGVRGMELMFIPVYDRQGFPIPARSEEEPGILVMAEMQAADPLLQNVAQSDFPDGSWLSTSWMGFDLNWGGRPLFFETMYFSGKNTVVVRADGVEIESSPVVEFPVPGEPGETTTQLRYGSEEEALAAHHEITRLLRKRWLV